MAGLGEACSHIAAVLFTMEANTRIRGNVSCTSELCSWLPANSQTVQYATVSDIDFTTPALKRRRMVNEEMDHRGTSALCSCSHQTPKPTDAELMDLYHELSSAGKPVCCLLFQVSAMTTSQDVIRVFFPFHYQMFQEAYAGSRLYRFAKNM